MSIMEQRLGPGMLYEGPSLEPGIVRTYPDGIMWLIKPDGTRCIIPCAGGGGGGAPVDAEYVVLALNATLTAERVLTAGDALLLTDGGAGGPVTLDVLVDGTSIQVNGLNQLEVVGGTSAPVNAEYVVMSLDPTLTDERVLTAGDGLDLTDGGAGGNALLDVLVDGTSIGFNGSNQLEVLGGSLTTAVIKNPLTSIRNTITGTGNVIELPIVGEAGQTEPLFTAAANGMIPFFRLFPDRTIAVGAGTFVPATYEGFQSLYVFSRNPLVAGGGPAITPGAGGVTIPFRLDTEVSPTANTTSVANLHNKLVYDTAFTTVTLNTHYAELSFRGMKAAGSGAQVTDTLYGMRSLTDIATASTGDVNQVVGLFTEVRGRGTGTLTSVMGLLTRVTLSNNNPPVPILRGSLMEIALGSAGTTIPNADGIVLTLVSTGRVVTLAQGLNLGNIGGTGVVESRAINITNQTGGTTSYAIYGAGGQSRLHAGTATVVPLTLKGAAAQSGNLFNLRDSTDALLTAFSETGVLEFGTTGDTNLYRSAADVLKTDDSFHVGAAFRHLGAALGFFNVAQVAQQSASTITDLWTALKNYGLLDGGSTSPGNFTDFVALSPATDARNVIQPTAATVIPLTVKGFAAQSDDLTQWVDSAAATLVTISAAGVLQFGSGLDVNLYRGGANQIKTDDDLAVGANTIVDADGFVEVTEIAAPATPAANKIRLFAVDDGAGNTQLAAKFASGNTVILAVDFV